MMINKRLHPGCHSDHLEVESFELDKIIAVCAKGDYRPPLHEEGASASDLVAIRRSHSQVNRAVDVSAREKCGRKAKQEHYRKLIARLLDAPRRTMRGHICWMITSSWFDSYSCFLVVLNAAFIGW